MSRQYHDVHSRFVASSDRKIRQFLADGLCQVVQREHVLSLSFLVFWPCPMGKLSFFSGKGYFPPQGASVGGTTLVAPN